VYLKSLKGFFCFAATIFAQFCFAATIFAQFCFAATIFALACLRGKKIENKN
jgi:hypothetical protein